MSDLRTFLHELRQAKSSDLLEVTREVSPRYETAAIVARLEEKRRSPMVVFSNVTGSRWPVVSNVCSSPGRIARALGCSLRDLSDRWAEAVDQRRAPIKVTNPAVQENVIVGDDVDLGILPPMVYHEHDTDRPYLTASIVAARDPDTQKINLSFHRMMIRDRNTTGIFIERGKHLDRIYGKYSARGEAMPIGVFLGSHPAWMLGAVYSGSADVEEFEVIGGLMRAPIELAPCLTQPSIDVPARAELVLEGFVPPDERTDEGPFGEFTGFGTGRTQTPVFHVTALAHRTHPYFQDVISGHMEHLILPTWAIEHRTRQDALAASKNVKQVALPAPMTTVVALDKQDDDEPLRVIRALLEGDIYAKHVIVVDAEVDAKDLRQVMVAVALHVQADRDLHVFPNMQGTPLDPSCTNHEGRIAKLGIDATQSMTQTRALTRNTIPKAVWDSIDVADLLRAEFSR